MRIYTSPNITHRPSVSRATSSPASGAPNSTISGANNSNQRSPVRTIPQPVKVPVEESPRPELRPRNMVELQLKVKLLKDGQDDEIRRFKMDRNVLSFAILRNKISQLFPECSTGSFKLFWKDDQDESIAFSSDDELLSALENIRDNLFYINIRVEPFGFTGFPMTGMPGFMPGFAEQMQQAGFPTGFDMGARMPNPGAFSPTSPNMFSPGANAAGAGMFGPGAYFNSTPNAFAWGASDPTGISQFQMQQQFSQGGGGASSSHQKKS